MNDIKSLVEIFPKLKTASIEQIAGWLKGKYDPVIVENELGNRILYPQTLPIDEDSLEIDLALLREGLRLHPDQYFNAKEKTIVIPEEFMHRFVDLKKLAWAFADCFSSLGITFLALRSDGAVVNLGTIIKPEVISKTGTVILRIIAQVYRVKIGGLVIIPQESGRVDIKFESAAARLQGKNSLDFQAFGGRVGIMVDTRGIKNG